MVYFCCSTWLFYHSYVLLQIPPHGKLCRTDKDCEKGLSDQHNHGNVIWRCNLCPGCRFVMRKHFNARPINHLFEYLNNTTQAVFFIFQWKPKPLSEVFPWSEVCSCVCLLGVQTGACVKLDIMRKTCEVRTWCPIENKKNPRCCNVQCCFTINILWQQSYLAIEKCC